jgi:hypothetical protein
MPPVRLHEPSKVTPPRPRDFKGRARTPVAATCARPRSDAKIEVMAARARRGEELFHPLDAPLEDREGFSCYDTGRGAMLPDQLLELVGESLRIVETKERPRPHRQWAGRRRDRATRIA